MKKRCFCLLLTFLMCLSSTGASAKELLPGCVSINCGTTQAGLLELYAEDADNLNREIPVSMSAYSGETHSEPSVEILYESRELIEESGGEALYPVLTRGNKVPASFWNLSTRGAYLTTMPDGVGDGKLYTNYYFDFLPYVHTEGDLEGVAGGKIYTRYTIYTWDGSTGTSRMKLTLHCKGCKEELISHTSKAAGAGDKTGGPVTAIAAFSSGGEHRDHFCYFTIGHATIYPGLYGSLKIAHSNSGF